MRTQSLNIVRRLVSGALPDVAKLAPLHGAEAFAAQVRSLTATPSPCAAAQSAVSVEGNLPGLLAEVERLVSSEAASAKEVADAAVALAYLQVKGDRKLWGSVLQKALSLAPSLDPASLANLAWATSTANVTHYKTMFELSAPLAAQMDKFTSTQLSLVVEALGKAGAKDVELFDAIAKQVTAKATSFTPSELTRVMWGFAAAGVSDAAVFKSALAALAGKELSFRELSQASWALAKAKRGDKASMDALIKGAKKSKDVESPSDAGAFIWSCAHLSYTPPSDVFTTTTTALKSGAADLPTDLSVHSAWGLAALGHKDAALYKALLDKVGVQVSEAPESVGVEVAAALHEAACMVGADVSLPAKVSAYASKMYALTSASASHLAPQAVKDAQADVAEHTARAMGNKYRPDINAAIKGFAKDADGLALPIAVDVAGTNVSVELTADAAPSGSQTARAAVLAAKGYKAVFIPLAEYSSLPDSKAKAAFVLNKMKVAAPATSGKVNELLKDLEKPFNPYA